MKKLILLPVILFSCFFCGYGQLLKVKQPVADTFSINLTKVVLDFKRDFRNIQGTTLSPQGDMDVYKSKVTLPGALHCVVYRFHSGIDTTASWQAVMYEGDDYKEAVKKYKEVYKRVKGSRIKWVDSGYVGFKGTMEQPDENLNFAISSLQLDVIDQPYKKFFAEIELVGSYDGWEVHLNLHNKKSDTEE